MTPILTGPDCARATPGTASKAAPRPMLLAVSMNRRRVTPGRWFPKESLCFSLTDCTPCLRFFTPLPGAPRLAGRCRHHVLAEWPVYDEPYAAEAYNRPGSEEHTSELQSLMRS